MNQHKMFREHIVLIDTFRDRLHSDLRIGGSIAVSTEDMIARFTAEYGDNIFFKGFVSAVIDLYDTERYQLLKPNDVVLAKLNKNKIQNGISEHINAFFDTQLNLMCSEAYFRCTVSLEHFSLEPSRTVIAADDYTFNVFHECDNCLLTVLAEIGQLVHKTSGQYASAASAISCSSERKARSVVVLPSASKHRSIKRKNNRGEHTGVFCYQERLRFVCPQIHGLPRYGRD